MKRWILVLGCYGFMVCSAHAAALSFQSLALHRGKMGATRDEGDIGARLTEQSCCHRRPKRGTVER
jgi:hypothetical protein